MGTNLKMSIFVFGNAIFFQKKRKPKLFWLSAASPMAVVIIGGLLAYIFNLKEHGIQIVCFLIFIDIHVFEDPQLIPLSSYYEVCCHGYLILSYPINV